VYHKPTDNPDVVQVIVPAFLFTGVHGQSGTLADDVQRGSDVMGNGKVEWSKAVFDCEETIDDDV